MVKFLITSIFMGIGLALDSAAVSMTNGLTEPKMTDKKNFFVSMNFGLFQGIMPLIGYFISSAFIEYIEKYIPWIALVLLLGLGGKSILETIIEKNKNRKSGQNNIKNSEISANDSENNDLSTPNDNNNKSKIGFSEVIVQGIATSIDALCIGVVIANYTIVEALVCAGIIAVITFALSFVSTNIGKKFGYKFESSAELISGIILILIGLEIWLTGLIGL